MVECNDVNCFVHGSLRTRGSILEGRVVSDKGKRTVIVERELVRLVPKYERYARSRSRIPAHNPECIGAKLGDLVRIAECRKISKTKAWTVVKVLAHGTEPAVAGKKATGVKAKNEGKGA
ncbi:MAG: 30S ribosomal protein S17 [Candidatus Burarchaeum sp.]|nr:30S ribosomal protein S17 [Candidatus Burarchaeum sp.]MDO8339368.1 30S ribosomal protein S17 [Candidatus Burarchaeum sp.]